MWRARYPVRALLNAATSPDLSRRLTINRLLWKPFDGINSFDSVELNKGRCNTPNWYLLKVQLIPVQSRSMRARLPELARPQNTRVASELHEELNTDEYRFPPWKLRLPPRSLHAEVLGSTLSPGEADAARQISALFPRHSTSGAPNGGSHPRCSRDRSLLRRWRKRDRFRAIREACYCDRAQSRALRDGAA